MKIYCIHLHTRPDKMKQVMQEFPKLDLDVEFFDAVWMKRGHDGCIASHVKCMEEHKHEGIFAIIEDDIKVVAPKSFMDKAIEQLPDNWDALYLGATLTKKLERYSKNLFRLQGGLTTHFIIWNNQNGVCDYIIDNIEEAKHVDSFMVDHVQTKFNCFITNPLIATQTPNFSDTANHFDSYDIILKSYNQHTRGW